MFGQAVCCFLAAMLHLLWRLLERIWPSQDVELAPEFPSARQASGFENNPWAPSKVGNALSFCTAVAWLGALTLSRLRLDAC